VTQIVEACDGDGDVIGFFAPDGDAQDKPPAGLEVPLSPAEMDRRRQVPSGRTLDEILRGLDR